MKSILILILFIENNICGVLEISKLARQTLIAMSGYLKPCDYIPHQGKCVGFSKSENLSKNEVEFLVWNQQGEIIEVLTLSKPQSRFLKNAKNAIFFTHDFGQSSCSLDFRQMIKNSLKKQPNSVLISIDYSPIVG